MGQEVVKGRTECKDVVDTVSRKGMKGGEDNDEGKEGRNKRKEGRGKEREG